MTAVATVSLVMLTAAGAITAAHAIRSTTLADRAIAVDMLVALVLNGLAVAVAWTRDGLVVTLVLIIGLLAFLGTVVVARYIERRGL